MNSTIKSNPTNPTISTTKSGRSTVRYTDPVTLRSRRRTFRSRRDAEILVRHLERTGAFWANSAVASMCADVREGRVVTIHV